MISSLSRSTQRNAPAVETTRSTTRRQDEGPQAKRSRERIDLAVKASATTLTELFGVGPIIAATLIGHSGDIGRFRNRDHRELNQAIHMAAVTDPRCP